jgi:hypothetical protein
VEEKYETRIANNLTQFIISFSAGNGSSLFSFKLLFTPFVVFTSSYYFYSNKSHLIKPEIDGMQKSDECKLQISIFCTLRKKPGAWLRLINEHN